MKAICEVLEVFRPEFIRLDSEVVPVVNVIVMTVEEHPSTFMLSIWGDKNVSHYRMKPGEHYRIEFVIKGKYCNDGQFRIQQIKLIRAKRKKINDHLYIIVKEGAGVMKVGRSVDPQRRLEELQISSEKKLHLTKVLPEGGFLESGVHEQLKDSGFHVKGEWFKYTRESFEVVCDYYAMCHGELD